MKRCYLCDEQWFGFFGHENWYIEFRDWVRDGECFLHSEGLSNFDRIVPQEKFYFCLNEYIIAEDKKKELNNRIAWKDKKQVGERQIIGGRDEYYVNRIANAGTQGVQFLRDIRYIEKNFGLPKTCSYYKFYLDYE